MFNEHNLNDRKFLSPLINKLLRVGIFLSKLIPDGLHVPILRGPLKGAKWIVGAATGEGKGLSVILNLSEPKQISFAMKLIKPNGIC